MARGLSTNCRFSFKKGKSANPLRRVSKQHHRRQRTRSNRRKSRTARRRPLPAFFLFMEDQRPQLRSEHPDWTVIQMAKKLGAMWHQQPCTDQERYKKEAAQLRQAYHKQKGTSSCGKNQKKKKKKKKKQQQRKNKRTCRSLADDLDCLVCC